MRHTLLSFKVSVSLSFVSAAMSPSSLYLKPLGTIFSLLLLFGILATEKVPEAANRKRLNGILFLNDHFGSKIGPGRYSGFSAEVLDQISQLTTLDFNLTDIPFQEGRLMPHVDLMMGPLGDMTPLPGISFSEPLFEDDNLVAVVSRAQAKSLHLCSIHDLFPNTTEPLSNTTLPLSNTTHPLSNLTQPLSNTTNTTKPLLEIWSLQGVNHLLELELYNPCDPDLLLRRFPDYIWAHMYLSRNYADSMMDARRGEIALLASFRRAQKMIEKYDCKDFVILRDELKLARKNVVIFLRKGSPYLEEINEAIRKLKKMGIMEKLVRKTWHEARGECPKVEYCN